MKPTRNRHETDGNRQKLAAITPISWRASRSVHECADRARRSAAKGLIFGVLSPSLLARCGAGWSRSDRLLNLGETDETDTIFGKSDRPTGGGPKVQEIIIGHVPYFLALPLRVTEILG